MEQEAVLALYRPQPDREPRLWELVTRHVPLLRKLGLLSDGPAVLMRTQAGTYVEIFRWRSPEAARQVSTHPEVRQLWRDIHEISDSPAIDADPEPTTDAPRFVSVTLTPRSSKTELERPKLGRSAAIVGALSFVPFAGAPVALAAVIWGLLTKKRGGSKLVWLGLGGIGVSIVAVIAIIAFVSLRLPFGPAERMMTQMHLASAVEAVEFHKVQTGHYPDALTDLRETVPPPGMLFMVDMSQAWAMMTPKLFYYERIDADHYYLLGDGPDGQPFTADDVVPAIDIRPGSHVGLTVKH